MRAAVLVVLIAAAGCAAIVGVKDRTGTVCARETHDVCEDFDNPGAAHVWNGPDGGEDPRVVARLVASDESPPNALEIAYPALDTDASATGLFGQIFQDRSPDGMKISFDLRVDELGVPDVPLDPPDARPTPLPVSGMAFAIVQWNRGGIALAAIADGAYVFLGVREGSSPTPRFDRATRLATRADFVGRWINVAITFLLSASPPAVEVRFGERPGVNPTFDPAVTQITQSIDCLFGGVSIGPTGPNRVTFDNVKIDFPK